MGRVDALDVECRVGLGVAERLGVRESRRERQPLVAHLRQDVVRGAIDDPGQPLDPVARQSFAQRLDDRDAAGHRRLEGDHHAALAGRGEDLVAVQREQRLVGGDDGLALGNGLGDEVTGDLGAADQFADDVDRRIEDDFKRVVDDRNRRTDVLAWLVEVTDGDARDFDPASGAAFDFLGVTLEDLGHAAADDAEAEQADADRLHGRHGATAPVPVSQAAMPRPAARAPEPPAARLRAGGDTTRGTDRSGSSRPSGRRCSAGTRSAGGRGAAS